MEGTDTWRPLLRHTKLHYDECYAKLVLERCFPDRYENLQISDKPDLRDNIHQIGIEVTSAIPPKTQEALNLASEIPYICGEKKERRIKRLQKLGYTYTDWGMTGPGTSYSLEENTQVENTPCNDFLIACNKKIDKLNNTNYDECGQYDLFVQTELFVENWMLPQIMNRLLGMNRYEKKYSLIYLLALEAIYIFDIDKQQYTTVPLEEKIWGLGEKARELVEKGEAYNES